MSHEATFQSARSKQLRSRNVEKLSVGAFVGSPSSRLGAQGRFGETKRAGRARRGDSGSQIEQAGRAGRARRGDSGSQNE